MSGRRVLIIIAVTLSTVLAPAGAAPAAAPSGTAADGPGSLSHFDLARKDCVGTARNRASKVWYTIADGVLSDVYFPTVDNTNVETLQYVVTDGSSRAASSRFRRGSSSVSALRCRATRNAPSPRTRCRRRWTCSRPLVSTRPTSSTTRCTRRS
jgi:glucoamylase